MKNYKFEELSNNELMDNEGGSLTVGAAVVIIGVIVLGGSAIVSAVNGYQEEKRACNP